LSTTHYLKIDPVYFDAHKRGDKTFEVRRDDRGFQKGDTLVLCKYGKGRGHSGIGFLDERGSAVSSFPDSDDVEKITCEVLWILTGGQHGIEPGYVVMATKPTNSNKEVGE
jgi:hypothetical protein